MWMSNVFSFQVAHTLEEATTSVLMSDLSFVYNLLEGEKMELVSKLIHNMSRLLLYSPLSLLVRETSLIWVIPLRKEILGKGNVKL